MQILYGFFSLKKKSKSEALLINFNFKVVKLLSLLLQHSTNVWNSGKYWVLFKIFFLFMSLWPTTEMPVENNESELSELSELEDNDSRVGQKSCNCYFQSDDMVRR